MPHVGSTGDGLYYAYGYCGNGTALSHTIGKVLRDLVLERTSAYTNLLFVDGHEPAYRAEPLSYLGARTHSMLMALQDRYPKLVRRQIV